MIEAKYPLVENRWGFFCRKNYSVQEPSAVELQNAIDNGLLNSVSVSVTGIFCFGVDGCIVWGKHNIVDTSLDDDEISQPFQEKICRTDINLDDYGVVADATFPVSDECFRRIITPIKKCDIDEANPLAIPGIKLRNKQITSCVRACGWGIGAVEKAYPRLSEPLPFDSSHRGLRLRNIYRLYNFRVRVTNISQIRSVYFQQN